MSKTFIKKQNDDEKLSLRIAELGISNCQKETV